MELVNVYDQRNKTRVNVIADGTPKVGVRDLWIYTTMGDTFLSHIDLMMYLTDTNPRKVFMILK